MKLKSIFLPALICAFGFLLMTCNKEEVDLRKLVIDPIYPNSQPGALNNALVIFGELIDGLMPSPFNPEKVNITISVPSALITNDNFLFLPFAFDVESDLQGMYLQVEGANGYWNAPIDLINASSNSFAIAIGIPEIVQEGTFIVRYQLYDSNNNVSDPQTIEVTIVPSENRCGTGQGFPRVEGNDGITVKTYDFGDEPGTVRVGYYMYTQKDRMDIRYNRKWVASTSPVLLQDGEAPPFKTCNEASPADGFVSNGGSFDIPYDPAVSREISIYVSGCLQGGTVWYFDVDCPATSTPPPSTGLCGKSSVQAYYDPTDPDYHIYPRTGAITLEICDPDIDPINCTLSKVFDAMLKNKKHVAPTRDTSKVEDCKVTWVDGYLPGENAVVSTVSKSSYTVTNYTLKNELHPNGGNHDHFLHPGKVVRTIRKNEAGKIEVATVGEGTGSNILNLNVYLSGAVWGAVDDDLKEYWDKNK